MADLHFARAAEAVRRFASYVPAVLERLMALSRQPTVQRASDVLLALAIFAGSVGDIFRHQQGSGWGGSLALELVAAILISAPLLWRKRFPIAVLALVFAGGLLDVLLVAPRQGGLEPFVAEIVAYYSLGAHASERRSTASYAASLLVTGPAAFLHQTPGNAVPILIWTLAAWLVGRIIRSWRGRALALERANRELQEQRELQAQAAVAVERGRIARELHDVIAHNVSMIVVQAGAAARVLEGQQEHVRAALEAIETTGRETVDEMRRLLGVLRQSDDGLAALAPQPGLAELEKLLANVREAGLPVELRVEGMPAPLPPGLDLTAYRIAQEALTNALKHAGPARAEVTVRYQRSAVEIEVRDEGNGAPSHAAGTGHGLIGMRERAALWGGSLEAGRTTEGWRVCARLPLEATA